VTVPISVSGNTNGFAAVGLIVSYDVNVLTLDTTAPVASLFPDLPVQLPLVISNDIVGDRIFQWILFANVLDMTEGFTVESGVIANVNFIVNPNAAVGSTTFVDLSFTPAPRSGIPVSLGGAFVAGAQAFGGNVSIVAADTQTPPPPPPGQFSVTVNANGGAGATGTGNYAPGATVSINAGTRPGFTFSGWTAAPGVTFANAVNASTTFVMPSSNVTVTASWTQTGATVSPSPPPGPSPSPGPNASPSPGPGSGGGGSGSGSGGGSAGAGSIRVLSHFGTWTGNGTSTARVDAEVARFVRLLLNNNVVNATHYTVTAGSTVITFNEAYLRTLDDGTYTYRAEFTNGHADLTLIVSSSFGNVAQTGVENITGTVIAMWLSIFLTVFLVICLIIHLLSKRKSKAFYSRIKYNDK